MNTLNVQERGRVGTGGARAVRREGRVPAVLYGLKTKPENFSVCSRAFARELEKSGVFSRVFTLTSGKKKQEALVRDIQFHSVTDTPLHIDFVRIDRAHAVTVKVPVVYINEEASPGLKMGGVLNVSSHEIEISCALKDLPESISIDLTGLNFHETIHARDVPLPEGATLAVHGHDRVMATIVAPTIMPSGTTEEASGAAGSSST